MVKALIARMKRRLLKIAILLLVVMSIAAALFLTKRADTRAPRCAGLSCYDDSDCGTRCYCDRSTSAVGRCIAK